MLSPSTVVASVAFNPELLSVLLLLLLEVVVLFWVLRKDCSSIRCLEPVAGRPARSSAHAMHTKKRDGAIVCWKENTV